MILFGNVLSRSRSQMSKSHSCSPLIDDLMTANEMRRVPINQGQFPSGEKLSSLKSLYLSTKIWVTITSVLL